MQDSTEPSRNEPGEVRKLLTIVFCDISGSTRLSSTLEPEDYVDLLDRLRQSVRTSVERHGGTLVRIDGDGFIFIFGHPHSHDDANRRAIEATLEIHEASQNLNSASDVALHSGIHSGVVLLRSGDMSRGRYEILGEPTNICARICEFAKPGEIMVSAAAMGADRKFFMRSEAKTVDLPGMKAPLVVRQVLGRRLKNDRLPQQPSGSKQLPFFGRETEMEWLYGIEENDRDTPTVAIIEAEAGIGKTRLVTHFLAELEAAGRNVVSTHCDSYLGVSPLYPFRELLRSIENRAENEGHNDGLTVAAERASEAQTFNSASPERLDEIVRHLHRKLDEAAGDDRIVLFFDDWHWADDISQVVLSQLVRQLDSRVTVLLAMRPAESFFRIADHVQKLNLSPLSADASQDLVNALAPAADPFVVRSIFQHAEGNPLYTEELCHIAALGQDRFTLRNSDSWMRTTISNRFFKLPEELSKIVELAAIMGQFVSKDLLELVLGEEVTPQQIRELKQLDFLFPDDRYKTLRFKHGLTREAVYSLIGLGKKRALHLKAGEVLLAAWEAENSEPDYGQAAYHFSRSGDAARGMDYSIAAGQLALAASALGQAQFHFSNALQQIVADADLRKHLGDVLRGLGQACISDPSWEQLAILDTGINLAKAGNDIEALGWGQFWKAFVYYGLGEPRTALELCLEAKASASQSGDTSLMRQVETQLGQARAAACDVEAAEKSLDRSINGRKAQNPGRGRSISLAYSLAAKAFLLGDQGKFQQSFELFDEAIGVMGGPHHRVCMSILTFRSTVHLFQSDMDAATAVAADVMAMAERMQSRYLFAIAQSLKGAAIMYSGDIEQGLATTQQAVEWMESGGSQQRLSLSYGYLCDGYAQTGDWSALRATAAKALKRARKGDRFGETNAWRALSLLARYGTSHRSPQLYRHHALESARRRRSPRELYLTEFQAGMHEGQPNVTALSKLEEMGIAPDRFVLADPANSLVSSSR